MNTNELAYRRLRNQLVCHHPLDKVDKVVQWMGAIQAQDYRASLWAIGLRLAPSVSAVEATVKKATAERKIVRTWPMRGTLHWVAAADARWMLRLLTLEIFPFDKLDDEHMKTLRKESGKFGRFLEKDVSLIF